MGEKTLRVQEWERNKVERREGDQGMEEIKQMKKGGTR
jgi:hypothetical protein